MFFYVNIYSKTSSFFICDFAPNLLIAIMRILVISDTHLGHSLADIPAEIYSEIARADAVIHAGDIGSTDFVETMKHAGDFYGVYGNMDTFEMTHLLPESRIFTLDSLNIGLAHGFGHYDQLPERIMDQYFKGLQLDILIYGHSHIPCRFVIGGTTCINPGSLAMNRNEYSRTYGILQISGKSFEYEVYRL